MKHIQLLTLSGAVLFFFAGQVHGQTGLVRMVTTTPAKKGAAVSAEVAASKAITHLTLPESILNLAAKDNFLKAQLRRAITYQQEYENAYRTRAMLFYYQRKGQTPTEFLAANPEFKDRLINKSLSRYVSQALEADNYDKAFKELTEYYGLEEGTPRFSIFIPSDLFAASAVDYMVRHPHKINLRVRELVESLYGSAWKEEISYYAKKDKLTKLDQEVLYHTLKRAYRQYMDHLIQDEEGFVVKLPLRAYQENIQALKVFIEQTGRFPRMNAGPEESHLAMVTDILWKNMSVNRLRPTEVTMREFERLRKAYPQIIWTKEVFLQEYQKFVTKYPEFFYPRPWQLNDYSEWDSILYDSYKYYLEQDSEGLVNAMEQIYHETNSPKLK